MSSTPTSDNERLVLSLADGSSRGDGTSCWPSKGSQLTSALRSANSSEQVAARSVSRSFSRLLREVYKAYPAYAVNSWFAG